MICSRTRSFVHSLWLISIALLTASCDSEQEGVTFVSDGLSIKTEFVEVGSDSLYIRRIGHGDPILVIHGGPGMDHTYFLPHLDYLGHDYELVYYDQRASGRSSINVEDSTITIAQFIEDIDAIRKYLGVPRLNILGHSWGGLLAMYYAIKHPLDVASLLLISSAAASTEFRAEEMEKLASRQSESDSLRRLEILNSDQFQRGEISAYEDLFRLIFKSEFYDQSLINELEISFQPTYLLGNNKLQLLGASMRSFNLHEMLESIDVPCLILYGDYDRLAGRGAQALHQHIKGSKLVFLKETGHFPFLENKREFFPIIKDFLSGLNNDH